MLLEALRGSWRRIARYLLAMFVIVTIFGAVMYIVERRQNGFSSIPTSMYWAVATVGFGNIVPATPLGQLITSVLILIGYGNIIVLAGIYAELAHALNCRRWWRRQADPAAPACQDAGR